MPPLSTPTPLTSAGRNRRFMEIDDRARRVSARVFAILTVLSGLYYVIWAIGALNPAHPLVGGVFVFAEVCSLGLFVIATIGVWRLRFKSPHGLDIERPYRVDVFVPICGEPTTVVRATLEAVAAIRWTGEKRVYVLDDGGMDAVKALAEGLGFTYLSRPRQGVPHRDAKAGNLNFGLAHSSGELLLVLDADQVPVPGILEALAGYMRFPKVAFVQSQQAFEVPDDDPFFNQDPIFYEALLLGFDAGDSVISCGSGVLYRRTALDEIDGFVTWNLVEDLTTSYELHSRGWKSFYYPFPLSRGLAPATIWGVYRQRGQWAFDTMRLFFWDSPLLKRGLSGFARATYLIIGLSYLCAAFVFPFFFLVPIWSYVTGGNVLHKHELEFAAVRGVYFVLMAIAMQLLFRGRQPGKQFQLLTGLFPIYARGALMALFYPRGHKPFYTPNNRARRVADRPRMLAVVPQLLVLGANAVLPFWAALDERIPGRLIAANITISALAIWSLLPVVLASLDGRTVEASPAPNPTHDPAT